MQATEIKRQFATCENIPAYYKNRCHWKKQNIQSQKNLPINKNKYVKTKITGNKADIATSESGK